MNRTTYKRLYPFGNILITPGVSEYFERIKEGKDNIKINLILEIDGDKFEHNILFPNGYFDNTNEDSLTKIKELCDFVQNTIIYERSWSNY